MRVKIFTALIFFFIFVGCQKGSNFTQKQNPQITKAELPSNGCTFQQAFSSIVKKVEAVDENSYYGLLHYQEKLGSEFQSILFLCDSGTKRLSVIHTGNPQSQIIDFAVSPNGNVFALLSNSSNLQSDENDFPPEFYRELEVFDVGANRSLLVFHDSNFKNGLFYKKNGEPIPSPAKVEDRTLLHSQFSTMGIAKIISTEANIYLTYVGSGGYKIARINKSTGVVQKTTELMPNTSKNSVLFARFPPQLSSYEDRFFVTAPIHKSELNIYNKHFGRNLEGHFLSDDRQVLLQEFDSKLNFIDQIIIPDASYLSEYDVGAYEGGVFVGASTTTEAKLFLVSFENKTVEPIILPVKSQSNLWDVEFCNGFIWGAGIAGYEQVSTGSIVTFGDAFLWRYDITNKASDVRYFGSDRNDSLETLSCGGRKLFFGGVLNGPITHTGDNDKSLNYQNAISGSFSF